MSAKPGLKRCVAVHKASKGVFPVSEMRLAYEELHGCCIRRPGHTCEVRKEFLSVALEVLGDAISAASGTEARQRQDRGTELGPKGDGPTVSDNEPGRPKDTP